MTTHRPIQKILIAFAFLLTVSAAGFAQAFQGPRAPGVLSNALSMGSSDGWVNSSNGNNSDNQYALLNSGLPHQGDFSNYFYATNYGFTIPAGSVIVGIKVEMERSVLNGDARDRRVSLLRNGVLQSYDKADSTLWPQNDAVKTYGNSSDLWGQTWTPAEVNNSHFGFAISIERADSGHAPVVARIDAIRMTIYYQSALLGIVSSSFTATAHGNAVALNWNSFSETGSENWTIERAGESGSFEAVSTLASQGEGENAYSWNDYTAGAGTHLYRIRLTNAEGNITYSEIESVTLEAANAEMAVYPNPATDGNFTIQVPALENGAMITLTDLSGQTLRTWETGNGGMEIQDAAAGLHLSAGIYLVHLQSGNLSLVNKVVVK